jgi:hypothetical protein
MIARVLLARLRRAGKITTLGAFPVKVNRRLLPRQSRDFPNIQ